MKWQLRDGARTYELALQPDPLLRFGNERDATTFLRRFLGDQRALQALRAAVREAQPSAGVVEDDELLRRAGSLLSTGLLRLGSGSGAEGGGGAEGGPACPACPLRPTYPVRWKEPEAKLIVKKKPLPPSKKGKPEKTALEIQLLDMSGEPIANERYVIELEDGTKKQGKLNGKGKARIDNIDPQTAKLTFPDLKDIQVNLLERVPLGS